MATGNPATLTFSDSAPQRLLRFLSVGGGSGALLEGGGGGGGGPSSRLEVGAAV